MPTWNILSLVRTGPATSKITISVTEEEKAAWKELAFKYCEGDLSDLIHIAVLTLEEKRNVVVVRGLKAGLEASKRLSKR